MLDINVVMQVHQMAAIEYRTVCIKHLGVIPDNNVRLPQKDYMAHFEKTARLFQARFKQPYSLCACGNSARTKFSSSLSIAPKKATSLNDILRVLGSRVATGRQQVADATHPCSHSAIAEPSRSGATKPKAKGKAKLHRNSILDPPEHWLPLLAKDAYGYGPAASNNEERPISSLRTWATTL